MGCCESVQEEEIYDYHRRHYRPRTPIVYSRPSRVVPVTTVAQPVVVPTVEKHVVVETPRYTYGGYYSGYYPY